MAYQAHLQENLELAVQLQALTLSEAWALQDALLMSPLIEVEVPPSLAPQVAKLMFFQAPPINRLPL